MQFLSATNYGDCSYSKGKDLRKTHARNFETGPINRSGASPLVYVLHQKLSTGVFASNTGAPDNRDDNRHASSTACSSLT
jgi:hypothetical protein